MKRDNVPLWACGIAKSVFGLANVPRCKSLLLAITGQVSLNLSIAPKLSRHRTEADAQYRRIQKLSSSQLYLAAGYVSTSRFLGRPPAPSVRMIEL